MRSMTSTSARRVVPVDLGHEQERRVEEVAAQLRAVGRLAREVELVADRLLELGDDLARPQPARVGRQALDQAGGGVHEREIVGDDGFDARPQHLHRDGRAVGQLREVDLRDRRARGGRPVELREHLVHRLAVAAVQRRDHLLGRERRHRVLQLRELVRDVRRQEVAPRRQHLAELHEDRPERLEREPQAHRARSRQVAPEQQLDEARAGARARARARAGCRRGRSAARP